MVKLSALLCLIVASFLSACALLGQSSDPAGDYSETQLGPDVFRITPASAADASPEKAQDLMLLRAADLCRQRGYKFFAAIAPKADAGGEPDYITYAPSETAVAPGESGLLIQGFPEKPDKIFVFDAGFMRHSLRQKYGMPDDEPAADQSGSATQPLRSLYPDDDQPASSGARTSGDRKADGLRPLYPDDAR